MNERTPTPPFTAESAVRKVRLAEDVWNSRDPGKVAAAYTPDTVWRNRDKFLTGTAEIERFLADKWSRELDYRLIKEVWAFAENKIAVRFAYESHNADGQWFRSYGNENWGFNIAGFMRVRHASINDVAIAESDRKFHWDLSGVRPERHPGLTELGL